MTQTAKHTPGPWSYAYAPYTTQDGKELPAFEIHGAGEKICDTVEDQPIEAQEANARLIAAAPELLQILQQLATNADEDCPAEYRTDEFREALQDAFAAIAEAVQS